MKTCVFFFGGYEASEIDMKVWVASAKTQRQNVDFTAYHWYQKHKEKNAVAAIKASKADIIYVVGHSSGAENANSVDEVVKNKAIRLISLDGSVPSKQQRDRPYTKVWSALNGNFTARNYDSLKKWLGTDLQEFTALSGCTTKWALHFSLVNANATDSIVLDPPKHLATGYAQCKANMCWLP